jgi:hypothetical protein
MRSRRRRNQKKLDADAARQGASTPRSCIAIGRVAGQSPPHLLVVGADGRGVKDLTPGARDARILFWAAPMDAISPDSAERPTPSTWMPAGTSPTPTSTLCRWPAAMPKIPSVRAAMTRRR